MKTRRTRILALDPTHHGIGFAVLEGGADLVDWGVRNARPDEEEKLRSAVLDLLRDFSPMILVLEDYRGKESRRCERVRRLLDRAAAEAAIQGVRVKRVSRTDVLTAFAREKAPTKHEIASAIVRRFPELTLSLPPPRKAWMSEHYRMAIFDAIALGMISLRVAAKHLTSPARDEPVSREGDVIHSWG